MKTNTNQTVQNSRPARSGRHGLRSGVQLLRVGLAALVLGAGVLVASAPTASAASSNPGGTPHSPSSPPPSPCLVPICITDWFTGMETYPQSGKTYLRWIFHTNVQAHGDFQVSRSPQTDANGDLVNMAGRFKTPYAVVYHNSNVGVPTGGKYYWQIKLTANGFTLVKKGEAETPYLANKDLGIQPAKPNKPTP